MSLLSSIQLAGNSLLAAQIGLQVTANNIANANTPDYVREEVVLTPAPTQRQGDLLLGLGVQVEAIIQRADRFLQERLRSATSDVANGETQEKTYTELQTIIGELGDTDLSTSLNSFFSSIHDILNQPESLAVRNLAVLKGQTLTHDIARIDARVHQSRSDLNEQVRATADDINRLISDIARLNIKIVTAEGGEGSKSDAVGLRDQQNRSLGELAKIIDIRVERTNTGTATVYSGGLYLVSEGEFRSVTTVETPDRGLNTVEVRLAETDSPLEGTSGKLAGLVASRDVILGGFIDSLNDLAQTLTFEFNRLYTSGQGLSGYTQLSSEFALADSTAALDHAGLEFTPVNGSFKVLVRNTQTGQTTTKDIFVRLNGLDDDTSLEDLVAQLDGVDGLAAEINSRGGVDLATEASKLQFAFADDTSGALAALGIATFFTGATAGTLGVSAAVKADPGKFAASSGGIGEDTRNAELLANFLERPLDSQNGATLANLYDSITAGVIQSAAVSHSVAEGYRVFQQSLEAQNLAVSGVNLDEEAIKLLGFQRLFQSSAKVIATVNELLDLLVAL